LGYAGLFGLALCLDATALSLLPLLLATCLCLLALPVSPLRLFSFGCLARGSARFAIGVFARVCLALALDGFGGEAISLGSFPCATLFVLARLLPAMHLEAVDLVLQVALALPLARLDVVLVGGVKAIGIVR
jgi:hypothetical protein